MQIKYFLVVTGLLVSSLTFPMEQKNELSLEIMTPITTWKDVTPFAGKVVAFSSNSARWSSDIGVRANNENSTIYFGYVETKPYNFSFTGESGYSLIVLVAKKLGYHNHKIIKLHNTGLATHGTLSMRLATPNEINSIRQLIKNNKAVFAGDTVVFLGAENNTDPELITLIEEGNSEMIKLILDTGGDPNVKDSKGDTALMVAIRAGNLEIVKLLMEAGADPNIENAKGKAALFLAAKKEPIFNYILEFNRLKRIKGLSKK